MTKTTLFVHVHEHPEIAPKLNTAKRLLSGGGQFNDQDAVDLETRMRSRSGLPADEDRELDPTILDAVGSGGL